MREKVVSRLPSPESDAFTSCGWRSLEPPDTVRDSLHRRPFRFTHDLQGSPLFSLEALVELSREIMHRPGDAYFDAGDVAIDDRWGSIPAPQIPLPEVISRVETAGAWIIMKHVEKNPAYAEVLDGFARYIWDIAGPRHRRLMRNPEMLIIINSPHRVTPLHFDAEVNFLVQVSGDKRIWICDPMDRNIVSERDLEAYYGADNYGTYRPEAEKNATCFTLDPGEGVHIPSHGAHWVRNGGGVSVSLSLNFEHPGWMHRDLYRANHYLRRLGVTPRPQGVSPVADRVKALGFGAADRARTAIRGLKTR